MVPLVTTPRATAGLCAVTYLFILNWYGQRKKDIWKRVRRKLLKWSFREVHVPFWPSCLPFLQHLKQKEPLESCELPILTAENVLLCVYWCHIGYITFSHNLQTGGKQLLNQSGSVPHHHVYPESFPSFVTLSCFSALYWRFPQIIFNSVCMDAYRIYRRFVHSPGQR